MAAAVRNREISSTELVSAHLQQIEQVNSSLNAVVRVLSEAALDAAKHADEMLARGETKGPLHGIPMTVKDAWAVAGVPSTGGTLGRSSFVPDHTAPVIERMRAAGAIPIGMTNLPELSFALESDNLLYGRTNNPYDLSRTPGGSGGGGAASIASGMSPVEIGADLAGSIRLPAHFSGIAGIRATTGRVPLTGYFPPLIYGWISMLCASGPMARKVEDLAAVLPIVSGPDWTDSAAQAMPLLNPEDVRIDGLRIAVHTDNGILPARADVAKTVLQAAQALADGGAEIEETVPTGIDQCNDIFFGIAFADKGEGVRDVLSMAGTKEIHPLLQQAFDMGTVHQSAGFLQGLFMQLSMYRSAMLGFMRNYDLILSPVCALPAVEHGTSNDVLPAFSYTIAHNLTGWPGAVVRCGTTEEGLPIGVQAVARPWREDVALAAAQHLETALGGYVQPDFAAPPDKGG